MADNDLAPDAGAVNPADPTFTTRAELEAWEYDDDANECGNCGGEGFTYGCSWDWQCDTYDEGEGTCLCTRRCEWCNPLTAAEIAERDRLRDVLATALAKDKVAEMRAEEARVTLAHLHLKGE